MQTMKWSDELIDREEHLLIGGTTGSGKSNFMQHLIASILCEDPREHKMVLVDPKRCEFERYRNCAHTMRMVRKCDEIADTLDELSVLIEARLDEMAERDEQFYWWGCRIHVIVDEFADIMEGVHAKKLRPRFQHVCQIGRAANVQVIAATQHPSRKVIPSEIQANFGIKIGLRTAGPLESKIILNATGCEALPLRGKCLVQDPEHIGLMMKVIPKVDKEELKALAKRRTPDRLQRK